MPCFVPASIRHRPPHTRAFTLLELIITILIILILAAIVAWAFVKIRAVVRSFGGNPPPTPAQPVPAN